MAIDEIWELQWAATIPKGNDGSFPCSKPATESCPYDQKSHPEDHRDVLQPWQHNALLQSAAVSWHVGAFVTGGFGAAGEESKKRTYY